MRHHRLEMKRKALEFGASLGALMWSRNRNRNYKSMDKKFIEFYLINFLCF